MTQSLRKVKRRRDDEQAAAVAEYGSAVEGSRAVPVTGLALGVPPGLPSTGPVAEPLPVVDALRRQVIRRSGVDAAMDLGSDSEDEVAAFEGTAKKAAAILVRWLRRKAGDATNYTVAVYDDDLFIAKVNGVTSATDLMGDLEVEIKKHGIEQTYNIYLCQKFNTAAPSNHAEMCVLAAIGEANADEITFLECTAPSCDFCDAVLRRYGVPNSSPDGEPASQQGWVHPFTKLSFGTQLGDHKTQVAELEAYLEDPTTELAVGRTTGKEPEGRKTLWL
jgi:hypothetical protein